MKISYNWLKQYVNSDKSPEEIARILTDTGLEVEGIHKIESVKGGLEGVVIGEVVTCEKHPDADRLKVTTVNVGTEELQIVCGAPNVAAGQKVVVATVGTTLYPNPEEPFKIKKSKIRGVESVGMLCAEDELGLGESHDGILVLSDEIEVGVSAASYFQLEDDYQLEIGLTPNRADAMGHIGVARDLVAYLNVHENAGLKINWPSVEEFNVGSNDLSISVEVMDLDACPRYTGLTISGLKVEASPAWLQNRLRSIGLSPINNVVDVTNFVMMELGTPLHAFDASEVGTNVIVRKAKSGEKFTTLDEVERELLPSDLMIANKDKSMCIGGVFGGIESGVSENTSSIFLESAYFNPVSVRKTAKAHGLSTDASFRFERGVDPNLTIYALKRAALLITTIAGGRVSMDIYDSNPKETQGHKVEFNIERCNSLIGEQIEAEEIDKILSALDIHANTKNGSDWQLTVPAYRVDVTREADVIEEVLRIYGFNNVSLPKKLNSSLNVFEKPDKEKIQNTVSEMLVGQGFIETMHNSLTKSSYILDLGGEIAREEFNVEILNPLSKDLDIMRQSLLFNMLETVAHNQNRQQSDLKLFEFGKIYHKFSSGYSENKRLIILISGKKESENWNSNQESFSFYSLKGYVGTVLDRLGLTDLVKEKELKKTLLEDGLSVGVLKSDVGQMGWISQKWKKYFGIKNDVFVADLDWDKLIDSLQYSRVKFEELPKSFAARRDFSLLLDKEIQFSQIVELARNCDKKLLKDIGLFDVYEGDKLEAGKKSYAVSFTFQDAEATLKDQQIDTIMNKIRASLESNLGAQLR